MAGQRKEMGDFTLGGKAGRVERRGLSVEQKLELSHMLRQEQDYNRLQMGQREMLVYGAKSRNRKEKRYNDMLRSGYGRTSMLHAAEDTGEQDIAWEKMLRRNKVSLVMRGFLSILLLVIVLLMRFSGLSVGGVDYQNLMDSLSSDEFVKGIDFEELFSYTDNTRVQ